MAVIYYRDPGTGNWVALPTIGPAGPAGPTGPAGAAGSPGADGVIVSEGPAEPAPLDLILWVDPNDFQGDSGWQGFDARYVNVDGDTMTGKLSLDRQPVDVRQDATSGARYFVWGGGVLVQHFKGTDAGADQVNVLYSKPDSNFIRLGTVETAQTEQQIQIVGNPIRLMKKDATPFVPTSADHAVNKQYADTLRPVVSATAPASPVVGQLWATP